MMQESNHDSVTFVCRVDPAAALIVLPLEVQEKQRLSGNAGKPMA